MPRAQRTHKHQHPGRAKPNGDKGLTCVMEPRYVMGDSGGGLDVGVPLVMLPPEAEPREVPAGHKGSGLEAGFDPTSGKLRD